MNVALIPSKATLWFGEVTIFSITSAGALGRQFNLAS